VTVNGEGNVDGYIKINYEERDSGMEVVQVTKAKKRSKK
jgi:hypothetical protein